MKPSIFKFTLFHVLCCTTMFSIPSTTFTAALLLACKQAHLCEFRENFVPELGSAAIVSLENPSSTNEPSYRLHSAKNTMGSFRHL